MKTFAFTVLFAIAGYLIAGLFVPRESPKVRRMRRHFLKMRDKRYVFDKPVDDARSSIRNHNQIIGRKT